MFIQYVNSFLRYPFMVAVYFLQGNHFINVIVASDIACFINVILSEALYILFKEIIL